MFEFTDIKVFIIISHNVMYNLDLDWEYLNYLSKYISPLITI